jgi:hypothetical protein
MMADFGFTLGPECPASQNALVRQTKEADMPRISAHAASLFVLLLATTPLAKAADDTPATSEAGVSKIRIVRLSEVKGAVDMDRNIGRGYEPATANMPVVEKSRLRTGQGVAEVEFEDNSTLRLAPDSEIEFPQLERLASGATASSVQVVKGTVYASMVKSKISNNFDLLFGSQKIQLPPATHVRLQVGDNKAQLAVLDGAMRIEGPSGAQDVSKKKTVVFELENDAHPEVAKDISAEPFDSWDKQSADYHSRIPSSSFNSPYSYGTNDMMYYGNFADAGGCGTMWRPYFASAAWDPYANGAWAYYAGAGYSWVSPYPWGWTPYHYGSWSFCPGVGWGWMPGGMWNGLGNMGGYAYTPSLLTKAAPPSGGTGGTGARPAPPSHPPQPGESTITAVNTRPIVRSGLASADSFEFRRDSAGMGIPRETLGRLDKLSNQANQRGSANTQVYLSAPTQNGGRPTNTMAPPTMHRGPAPSYGGDMANPGMANPGFGRPGGGPAPSMSAPRSTPGGPSSPSVQSAPAPSSTSRSPR